MNEDREFSRRTFSLCVFAGAVIGAILLAVFAWFIRPK